MYVYRQTLYKFFCIFYLNFFKFCRREIPFFSSSLHSDNSQDVSNMALEILPNLVDKVSLSTIQTVLYDVVNPDSELAELSYGHISLLNQACLHKYEDILLEMSTGDFDKDFIFPASTFVPSLLTHFCSNVGILKKISSTTLINYCKYMGEDSLSPFIAEHLSPQKAKLLKLYFMKAQKKTESEADSERRNSEDRFKSSVVVE